MKILSSQNSLEVFAKASDILLGAVEHTLGPNGTNTAILNEEGFYSILNDGKSIVEVITSEDPAIAPALETLKQAAFETNRKAGDGTTSTLVIMCNLIKSLGEVYKDCSIKDRKRVSDDILCIRDILLNEIKKFTRYVSSEDYRNIAKVSLGSEKYADLIADAFTFTEQKATPIFIKADQPDVTAENVDGVQLTKIKWCTRMILDVLNRSEFSDLRNVVLFQPVDRFEELTQLLRKSFQHQGYTLLFYNELSPLILENLLLNLSQGTSRLIPISLNDYGKFKSEIMHDLADYTNTKVIDGADIKINDVADPLFEFGHIDKAVLTTDQVLINNNSNNDKKYKTFTTKSTIIKCGGNTKVDMEDNYKRIEDAVHSLDSAISYGAVLGAGIAYVRLAESEVPKEYLDTFNKFVVPALKRIYTCVDVLLVDDDILDSALVTSEVIKNSFTLVAQVMSTSALVHNLVR